MSDRTSIEFVEPRRLMVRLRGELSEDDVEHLAEELLPRVRKLGAEGELIIDLHELDSCTTAARMGLTEVQRKIANVSARTAFVADRPRFRGIGLFVAHTSGDPNARAFHVIAQAQAWLGATEGRIQSITSFLGRATSRPRRRPRHSSEELRLRVAKLRESSDDGEGGR